MDIPSWVGQKVAYKGDIMLDLLGLSQPQTNTVYSIREVRVFHRGVGVLLNEISNPLVFILSDNSKQERAYNTDYFAPLVDTKFESDIAMFKDILLHVHEYRDITEHA